MTSRRKRAPPLKGRWHPLCVAAPVFRCRTTGIWSGFLTREIMGQDLCLTIFLAPLAEKLHQLVQVHGQGNWSNISDGLPGRSAMHCRQRWVSQVRAKFQIFVSLLDARGHPPSGGTSTSWSPSRAAIIPFCPRSPGAELCGPVGHIVHGPVCLQTQLKIQYDQPRPTAQVDPSILKTPWTDDEDKKIVVAQSKLGNRFAEIAKILDGR